MTESFLNIPKCNIVHDYLLKIEKEFIICSIIIIVIHFFHLSTWFISNWPSESILSHRIIFRKQQYEFPDIPKMFSECPAVFY